MHSVADWSASAPGIPKEALEIHVKGTSVEIRGESAVEPTKKDGEAYVHRERTHVGHYRSLELPEPVVATDAKVTNGVLELELPKQSPTPVETDVKVPVQ